MLSAMSLIITVTVVLAITVFSVRRGREKAAEHAATGELQSPLHWTGNALVLLLFILTFSIMIINRYGNHIPSALWIAVLADAVALIFIRRALKRRFG
jgi:heme/copper-type cytochrome/quinol oxidase subunit 2